MFLFLQPFLSCDNRTTVLELKDVAGFKISETKNSDGLELEISGLAFHSSLAVQELITARRDGDLEVKVILTPTSKGRTGSFAYKLGVDGDVNRVLFGNERKVIWQRK